MDRLKGGTQERINVREESTTDIAQSGLHEEKNEREVAQPLRGLWARNKI